MAQTSKRIAFSATLPTLDQLTFVMIMEALCRVGGNKVLAAEMLGISSHAIEQKLDEYNCSD